MRAADDHAVEPAGRHGGQAWFAGGREQVDDLGRGRRADGKLGT
jgi:hypothetical protein